jgi:iron complex outermembrane recepter protein
MSNILNMKHTVRILLCGTAIAGMFSATQVAAQAVTQDKASDKKADQGDIIVTGTRIARRDFQSESPIATVDKDALRASGQVTIGEALQQMPQVSPGASATNTNFAGNFTGGGRTSVDLRGLGAQRTLVLIDGRRAQPSDSYNTVDLNTVPQFAVANVEIVTGGASAAYGSDAIAGVVNIITRKDMSGVFADIQRTATEHGGADTWDVNVGVAGHTDNAHFLIGANYTQRDQMLGSQRDALAVPKTAFYTPFPQDAFIIPDFVTFNLPSQAAINGVFAKYGAPANAVPRTAFYGVNPDGTIFNTGSAGEHTVYNMQQPGVKKRFIANGAVADEIVPATYVPPLERYSLFAKGGYDLENGMEAYAQGYFTQYSVSVAALPNLIATDPIPATNPFIPADLKTLLNSRANPNAPFGYLSVPYVTDFGQQTDDYTTYQILVGLRGNLPFANWTFDVYGSKGQTTQDEHVPSTSLSAVNALVNAPDGGASLCAGGLNLFPANSISASCVNFIRVDVNNHTTFDQDNVSVAFQGPLFTLPAGEVRAATGYEYRRNGYDFIPDGLLKPVPAGTPFPLTGTPVPSSPASGAVVANELYGELLIPILADKPFAERLELNLGYRYSDYNTAGGISTYKASTTWNISRTVMLRGGYQRAIRAPSPGELFQTPQDISVGIGSISQGFGDPCSQNSAYRAGPDADKVKALCVAQGVPAGLIDTYTNGATLTRARTSGNLNLSEETADTFTAGIVLQSPSTNVLMHGLKVSLDFYRINIADAIGVLNAQQTLATCFNKTGVNPTYSQSNEFCEAINRQNAQAPGQISYIATPTANLAQYTAQGVDLQLDWQAHLQDMSVDVPGSIGISTIVSYLDKYELQNAPGQPLLDYAGTIGNNQLAPSGGGVGASSHPTWRSTFTVNYTNDKLNVGFRWRYIDAMRSFTAVTGDTQTAGVPSVNYFDLTGTYKLSKALLLRAGITNLTDKAPPIYNGFVDGATYDILQRSFFVGVSANF